MSVKAKEKRTQTFNIEYKLLVYFILIASIPLLLMYYVTFGLLSYQLEDVQNERLMLTHHNLVAALENEKHNLFSDSIDYAHWSNMYSAVLRKDRSWLEENFNIISSPQKGVDLIYVLNKEGEVVYENHEFADFAPDCREYLQQSRAGKEFVTLAGIGDRLFILSFANIIDMKNTKAHGGYLVLGKEINRGFMEKLPKGGNFTYDFVYNGKGTVDRKLYNDYFNYFKASGDRFITESDNIQYFKMYDSRQKPVAMIYINETDSFIKDALHNIQKGLTVAASVTFLLAILFLNLLKNNIMQPIRLLRQKVRAFRNEEPSAGSDRGDEVMLLTEEFSAMCEEISNHDKELEDKSQRLEYLVYKDDITGAYNKRYYRKSIAQEYAKARDNNDTLSLAALNLDNFRYYSELVGRNISNITLKKIYEIVNSTVQGKGIICFDSTDEFRLIMPGVEYKDALNTVDAVGRIINETSFTGVQRLPKGHISVSIGLASFPKDALELGKLIDAVEDRVRRTKYFNQAKVGYFYSIFNSLRDDIEENKKALIYMSKAFLSVIDAMDEYTYTHTEGVVKYASIIADELNMSTEEKEDIKIGALLHDIGKLELGRELLNKREKLTDEDIMLIKKHPAFGVNMLKPLEFLDSIVSIVKYHHERYDGTGYPEGLQGEDIPLAARIIAVADSFDAMTTARAYRATGKSFQDAVAELVQCSGSQFDPFIVNAFVRFIEKNGYNFLLVE